MSDVRNWLNGLDEHPRGVLIEDVHKMGFDDFEAAHDLIQWMFPTMDASACQPHSPVLSWEDVQAIRADKVAHRALKANRQYYAQFLSEMGHVWLRQRDHNHLRITRAIQSLSLLVEPLYAQEFLSMVAVYNRAKGWPVNITSTDFWNAARFYGPKMDAKHK